MEIATKMITAKEKGNIQVTENQMKVIRDKYLRDDPSIEHWLDGVALNIALADIIFMENKLDKVLEGVDHKIVEKKTGKGKKSKMILLHQGKLKLDDRRENFKKFMENLYRLADEDEECTDAVQATREKFYSIMSNWEFLPNSPTLMNAGRELQQLSACYVLPIEDSIEGWLQTTKDAAIIHKCLTEDSLVLSNPGLKRINDLKPGERVMTEDGYQKISDVHSTGGKDVFKVETDYGYEITGSKEHLIRVVDNDGNYTWKAIGELNVNDWVAIQKSERDLGHDNLPEFDFAQKEYNNTNFKTDLHKLPKLLTPDLSYMFGAFLGDGSYNISDPGRIRFTIDFGSKELIEIISKIFQKLFGVIPKLREEKNKNAYELSVQSVQIAEWMRFLGVGKKSARNVAIPKIILGASRENIEAFIRGLFDTDGTVNTNGYITLTTSSNQMAKELQILMLLLGIPTIRRRLESVDSNKISITTKEGFINFRDGIGFSCIRKARRLDSIDENEIFNRKDYLPNMHHVLKEVLHGEFRRKFNDVVTGRRQLTKHQARKILGKYDIPRIKNMISRNQFYARVKNVKSLGTQNTFDITVPGKHHYIANGFVSHNSGGGTGFSVCRVRPAGDEVHSTKGVASGALSPLLIINGMTDQVKQGGTRRGANMGIMPYNHPDILKFIEIKKDEKKLQNFNISVAITQEFMDKVKKNEDYGLINPKSGKVMGKLNAREMWNRLVEGAWATGDPGLIMIDRINNTDSNPTPHIGQIEATNPCVTGDSLIATENGLVRMEKLAEDHPEGGIRIATDNRVPIKIMNRNGTISLLQVAEAGVSMNDINQAFHSGTKDVYRLETESGYEIKCTEDHKIFTNEGFVPLNELDLERHRVFIQSAEGRFNDNQKLPFEVQNEMVGNNGRTYNFSLPEKWSQELGQALGWLVGDGWLREGDENCRVGFTFSKDEKETMEHFKKILNIWHGSEIKEMQRDNGVYHLSYHSKRFVEFFKNLGIKAIDAEEKRVPEAIFTAPKEAVIGFLQGLFSSDGTVGLNEKNKTKYIRLTSKSEKLLKDVQLLLLNLGIKSKIYDRVRPSRRGFAYTTKNGEKRDYILDGILFELNISRTNIMEFVNKINFLDDKHSKKLSKFGKIGSYQSIFEEKIKSIEYAGKEKVYDLTEPVTHSFICNSIVVSNCGEQPLLPYEVCNLGSINVSKFVNEDGTDFDWNRLRECVHTTTHFLDNIVEVNNYPLPEIEEIAKGNRRIGLGVMGWAESLVKLRIPYNSDGAIEMAERLMKFIDDECRIKSEKLADERGMFPNWKGSIFDIDGPFFRGKEHTVRNCARTTIAPTGTIGITAGLQGAGIEPFFAIAYIRYNAAALDALKEGKEPNPKDCFFEVNPLFEEVAKKNNYFGLSKEALYKKIDANHKSVVGIKEIPQEIQDVFLTAHDLRPRDHVLMQAAFQKYTNNAVSKTINFPNSATVKEVDEAYWLAFENGCKGITIYRDGCKSFQVLNLNKKEDKKEAKKERNRSDHEMADYYQIQTAYGPLHIHINYDSEGPTRVFAAISPTGTEISGLTTALGIALSKYFEEGGDPVKMIKHLNSIKSERSFGFGPNKVDSIAHGIAKALRQHLIKLGKLKPIDGQVTIEQAVFKEVPKKEGVESLYCPMCFSSNVGMVSGCSLPTCFDCGYSKCS